MVKKRKTKKSTNSPKSKNSLLKWIYFTGSLVTLLLIYLITHDPNLVSKEKNIEPTFEKKDIVVKEEPIPYQNLDIEEPDIEVIPDTKTSEPQIEEVPEVEIKEHKGTIAIIIDDFGNQWDTEYVQGFINFPVPITLSIIPHNWASKKVAEACNGKHEYMVHMPMEPHEIRYIEKEKLKLLVGMEYSDIEKNIALAFEELPNAVGLNNHTGSKATADSTLMNYFFRAYTGYNKFFIDSRTTPKSVCRYFAKKYKVPFRANRLFLDLEDDEKAIEDIFRKAYKLSEKGSNVIVIGHVRDKTYSVLNKLCSGEFKNLNYIYVSELFK